MDGDFMVLNIVFFTVPGEQSIQALEVLAVQAVGRQFFVCCTIAQTQWRDAIGDEELQSAFCALKSHGGV